MSLTLPIRLRLPNPPAPFAGRERESARLRELLTGGRVAVLTGPPGIGKTALALKALDDLQRDVSARSPQPATLVTVNAQRPGQLVEHLLDVLGRALALPPDWRVLGVDRELALATLIDLADAGPWAILLDDAHPDHEPELEELLLAVRDYARASHWLLTAPSVGGRLARELATLTLEGLDSDALGRLAASRLPDRDAATRAAAIAESGGNPRLLLAGSVPATRGEPSLAAFRERLAAFDRPLRPEVLAAVTPMPSDAALHELVQRGQLLQLPRGLWLRRDASEWPVTPPTAALARELAAGLARCDDDEARLEAVRLWLFAGRPDEAAALLALSGEALCERGLAAELWAILPPGGLAGPAGPILSRWRAWAAFEWGDPRAAAAIVDEEPSDYLSAHLRARLRIAAGSFEEAREAAELAARLAPTDTQRGRALCRAGRALFSSGRPAEVLALVERVYAPEADVRVEVELLRADALTVLGRRDEAATVCERLLEHAGSAPAAARLRALLGVARVYLMQQRLAEGERTLDALLSARAERAGDAVSGRTALELAAVVAIQRGRLPRLRDLGARLLVFDRAYPVRGLFIRSYLVTADEWQRPPRDFRENAERLLGDARASDSPIAADVACYAEVLCARAALHEGLAPRHRHKAPVAQPPSPSVARSRVASLAAWEARWGIAPELPEEPEDGALEHTVLFALAHGLHRLAGGDAARAERTLVRALERAEEGGYALHALELRRSLALVAWSQGAWARLAGEAAALEALGTTIDAPRLLEEAAFFSVLGAGTGPPPPEQLEAWASADEAIRTRTRWSRWLLGGEPALDPVERRLLETGVAEHGWVRARPLRGAPDGDDWQAGCGLDVARKLVWGPGRVLADLSRHAVLWSVLMTLADRRGHASKEDLVESVWGVAEYHPLKHDNRLRVAVRKLRDRLGDGAAIETEDDGYALGGVWRVLGG